MRKNVAGTTFKSALLPHANTQSPDKIECNQSLRFECFYEPVSLIHMQYTPGQQVCVQQCLVSLRTAAHCME